MHTINDSIMSYANNKINCDIPGLFQEAIVDYSHTVTPANYYCIMFHLQRACKKLPYCALIGPKDRVINLTQIPSEGAIRQRCME